MKHLSLNKQSRMSVKKQTGLSVEQIVFMDIEEIDKIIENKIGKKLTYPKRNDRRLFGRGSAYLFLNRYFEFNHKRMNRIIKSI